MPDEGAGVAVTTTFGWLAGAVAELLRSLPLPQACIVEALAVLADGPARASSGPTRAQNDPTGRGRQVNVSTARALANRGQAVRFWTSGHAHYRITSKGRDVLARLADEAVSS